jgi:hypothetical protein
VSSLRSGRIQPEAGGRAAEVAQKALAAWFFDRGRVLPEPLVDGATVMRLTGLPAGPLVGRVIDEVAELQAAGSVVDRAGAERAIAKAAERLSRAP